MSRVTIDGHPHEILTSAVCIGGIVVAVIIISVLAFLLHKMKSTQSHLKSHTPDAIIDLEAQQAATLHENDCKQQTKAIYSEMKVFSVSANLKATNDPVDITM